MRFAFPNIDSGSRVAIEIAPFFVGHNLNPTERQELELDHVAPAYLAVFGKPVPDTLTGSFSVSEDPSSVPMSGGSCQLAALLALAHRTHRPRSTPRGLRADEAIWATGTIRTQGPGVVLLDHVTKLHDKIEMFILQRSLGAPVRYFLVPRLDLDRGTGPRTDGQLRTIKIKEFLVECCDPTNLNATKHPAIVALEATDLVGLARAFAGEGLPAPPTRNVVVTLFLLVAVAVIAKFGLRASTNMAPDPLTRRPQEIESWTRLRGSRFVVQSPFDNAVNILAVGFSLEIDDAGSVNLVLERRLGAFASCRGAVLDNDIIVRCRQSGVHESFQDRLYVGWLEDRRGILLGNAYSIHQDGTVWAEGSWSFIKSGLWNSGCRTQLVDRWINSHLVESARRICARASGAPPCDRPYLEVTLTAPSPNIAAFGVRGDPADISIDVDIWREGTVRRLPTEALPSSLQLEHGEAVSRFGVRSPSYWALSEDLVTNVAGQGTRGVTRSTCLER